MIAAMTGASPTELTEMPPDALRKQLAYYAHHTHWTERLEYYALHMLYYTVNANIAPGGTPVDIKKLQAPMFRGVTAAQGSEKQSDEEALYKAEEIAGAYGKHQ